MSALLPDSYTAWRHCIEVDCNQLLTRDFIAQRLTNLRDPHDHHTQQFLRRWGEPHHQQVIQWFERADKDIKPSY
ncbi:hypothetical protein [Xanthomonas campestris]|jgi:hypothetical protein|uniref:hypothetical protein n=1 Tax=Xanthomonas campestris TaxID=339 RepID=UPI001D13DBF7|nr:hypothetical protein [Xanthomonas campestris]MCC3254980.1 hypothetical protein [Xanthomonas campestris pv. armoraciae]MDX6080536.1 hypothetical protein [Xanthomonas campestris pv. incanae]MDX6084367.1 hypothetical protein [Xanthomonas campestris pv. incanae]MDX6138043.1 hypothetical protein [Xanthomonas campestris pv. incanae]MEA9482105.1 hypothetical protein [Xanthomonas campestris]